MPLELYSKRVTIPEIRNQLLFFGQLLPGCIYFLRQLDETGGTVFTETNRGCRFELLRGIKKESTHRPPVRFNSRHILRRRRTPASLCSNWFISWPGTQFEIAVSTGI